VRVMMTGTLLPAGWQPAGSLLRLAALGAIVYGTAASSPGLGAHGRPLATLMCVVLAAAGWLGWLAATALTLRRPVLLAALVVLVVSGSVLAGISPTSPALALCGVGVFSAAVSLTPLVAVALAITGIAALAAGALAVGHDPSSAAGYAAALGAISLGGFNRRQYQARLAQAEQLVTQTRRTQAEQSRAAALAERARIAREIHDVLAHSLSALAVQLDATDALLADGHDPARAQAHVVRARRLAVDGLTETRRAIGALRGDSLPLPDLLAASTEQYQTDTGTPARLVVLGTPRELMPDVALAAYRTAQEAITNARKHAPAAPVSVALDYRRDELMLTVTDYPTSDTPRPRPLACTGGGYGLSGLRERAELIGGTLTAGPDTTGWAVHLWLPI